MKNQIILVAVVLVAIAALSWEHQDHEEESARVRQELSALARAVASQSRQSASELEATHHRLEQLAATKSPPPTPAAPVPRPLAPDNDRQNVLPPPAAGVFDPKAMAEHLDSTFFHEGIESAWADATRRLLQDKVSSLLPEGSSLRSLECQSTLCRLELVHATDASCRQFQHRSFEDGPLWKGASVMRTEKGSREGESVTISYFAREGHALPLPDEERP